MKFIKIGDKRINVNHIVRYYDDRPGISCTYIDYVRMELITGEVLVCENITVSTVDNLINPKKKKPRPKGLK